MTSVVSHKIDNLTFIQLRLKECDLKILTVISSGGFASVRIAHWKKTQSKFAIKIFTKCSTEEINNEV
jgi:hypothetical protein